MNSNILYKAARILPDRLFLDLKYYKNFHKFPNWKNPQTFNEKLNWLKIHDHNPLYTTLVDKYLVKDYVANIIGKEYVIPTLGAWDRAEDIDFDSLPDQFVLKANHESGHVIICKDKNLLDKGKAVREMKAALKRDFYAETREWPYKNVKRKIIAEQYLTENNATETNLLENDLTDYKFTCFNGEVFNVMICLGRNSGETKFYFLDQDWKLQRLNRRGAALSGELNIPRPKNLDKMFQIAGILSTGFPYMRVDLYNVDGQLYFGELTLYPCSGNDRGLLPETDLLFGSKIDLNNTIDHV